ncbi:MAG: AAA family ATPase [Pseudomonadota bacterium]|nr:AAA family ATPase [Pseudomonadota bacterium]
MDDAGFASQESLKSPSSSIIENFVGQWAQFGMSRSPFDDAHNVYYAVSHWEEHLRYLQRFPAGPYPLLLIPGIVGCGKTTLLKRFVKEQNEPARIHYLRAEPQHSLNQLIYSLYHNTGLTPRSEANLPDLLHQLTELASAAGTQMLLIDNAHRLSRETLIRLLHLLFEQDVSQSRFHVVLCGDPQLQDKVISLLGEFAPGRKVPSIELESLSLQQTREYLEYRLLQAGLSTKFPFTPLMLKQVHALSGGFPGRINRVAQQVLLDAVKSQSQSRGAFAMMNDILGEHKVQLMGAMVLVSVGLLLWQFQPRLHSNLPSKMQTAAAVVPAVQQSHRLHFAAIDDVEGGRPGAKDLTVRQAILAAMEHVEAAEAKAQEDSYRTLALQSGPHYGQASASQFASVAPTQVAESLTKAVARLSKTEQELLSRRGYTVQLMGARDPDGLQMLINKHNLKQASYYRTQLKGKDWYVLVYGQFNSAAAATAAMAALPKEIQNTQPWIRPLASVHAAIQSKTHLATNDEDNTQG